MTISTKISIEELTIHTLRTLAMDAVQKADSGHPGTPMALAPLAYVLWKRFLRFHPKNPKWFNRDRFVLSCGHASLLLYGILFLTGYDISLEDIKNFRQWGSITPGHPENKLTPGVEVTTGPLGQGIMNAVGMAIAEAHLSSVFNRDPLKIVDHRTYVFCSDGDLMEGASHEAASVAGHLGLHKLMVFYDDNHISIEGKTEIAFTDNTAKRFEGYNWVVQNLGEKANDLEALTKAIQNAQNEKTRPSLIIVRSHIAYGAPHKQDMPEAHGTPLGEEEVKLTKKFYGWPEKEKFLVPKEVLEHMRVAQDSGIRLEKEWDDTFDLYQKKYPDLAKKFTDAIQHELPNGWDKKIPEFKSQDKPIATREASHKVLAAFASEVPWLIGGSGDLAPSTKTLIEGPKYIEKESYSNRNIAWGVREHVMCAAASGMALHEGVRPFVSTFFIFTDYARPAIRLASLMELPIIYVLTHDSIGLGEDGPTHQPIEHLASFRAMPNMCLLRPCDANETAFAWRFAMERKKPTMLILSRQNLPILDRSKVSSAKGLMKGAYILSKERGEEPDVILMASGSEVHLILEAQSQLLSEDVDARVISFPSWEIFRKQSKSYKEEVLPEKMRARLAVEAAHPQGWGEWVGEKGYVIGIEKFGASAPYKEIFKHYGFTVENVVKEVRKLINREDLH